ncbi:MAG: RNA-binding protein [Candidatus Omnitrophota bacterium]
MNIFVGNLSFGSTQDDVKKLFEGFGNVASVAIVMSKEKKAPKSRGFGFVEMPDEQQALAAIAALSDKEFMGRVLNVSPARPKTEVKPESKLSQIRNTKAPKEESKIFNGVNKERQPRLNTKAEQYPKEAREGKKVWGNSTLRKPGTYKGGRRTHSYMKRRGLVGMQEEVKPRRKNQENPMRWRKREEQPRPWQKSSGEHKPWKKTEEESKPWKTPETGFKPWKKSQGKPKPWNKTTGESRAWSKPGEKPNPWKKPAGDAKPWSKSSGRPQESRFKGRRKLRQL